MAWQATSYIPTAGTAGTRQADAFRTSLAVRPQPMTLYLRFLESGFVLESASRLCTIGSSAAANPRAYLDSNGSYYRFTHHNGSTSRAVTLAAAPTVGQSVELRAVLGVNGGVLLGQTINRATESLTTGSAALAFAQAWAGDYLTCENILLRDCFLVRGVKDLASMRRIAGTE